jgi:predicted nucleotidyltransferase
MNPKLTNLKRQIVPILRRHHVRRSSVFGSVARGEERKKSDVDLLVELPRSADLFDLAGLKVELEDKLGKKVDLVEYGNIYPPLKKYILPEAITLYKSRSNAKKL